MSDTLTRKEIQQLLGIQPTTFHYHRKRRPKVFVVVGTRNRETLYAAEPIRKFAKEQQLIKKLQEKDND
jgi:hypothetical protein